MTSKKLFSAYIQDRFCLVKNIFYSLNKGIFYDIIIPMMEFPKTVLSFYFKNMFKYAKGWPFVFMLFSIFDTAGHTVIPAFFIKMIVSTLENNPISYGFEQIIPVALFYLLLRSALVGGAVMRWVIFDNTIKYRSYNSISRDLYDYVYNQSIDFYANSMPGKINSQIDSVATGFYVTISVIFGNLLAIFGAFIVAFGGLISVGWQYLVVILLAASFRIGWGLYRVKFALQGSAQASKSLNTLHGRLLDALSNFIAVKTFAHAKFEQKCAEPYRKDYEKTARRGHAISRWFWAPGNFVMDACGMTALILVCGYMYSTGKSTIADVSFALSVFVGISAVSFNLIMEIKNFIEGLGKSIGSYDSLIQTIKITDQPDAKDLVIKNATIEVKDLSFKYNKNLVLKNLSFKVKAGEKIGIVGLSGAGKTTLVNLIMRLYDPTSGAIYIDDTDIKTITQESLHKNIGFIPQDSTMFNRTIRDNIKYGRLNATEEEIKKSARNASADKFIMSTPNKYDSFVGDRGIKLSGGQRQRIAIARAFLKNAPILILDEATSALDSETESVIQKSFTKLSKNRTTLVIAHRLSTLRNMDRLIVLENGKIVENGTHNSLLRKNGVYAKLWKMQSGGFISE